MHFCYEEDDGEVINVKAVPENWIFNFGPDYYLRQAEKKKLESSIWNISIEPEKFRQSSLQITENETIRITIDQILSSMEDGNGSNTTN